MHHAHICQWGLQLGNIDIDRVLFKIGTFCITTNLICLDICLTCKSVHLMFMCHFHVIFLSLSSIFGDFTDCHVFHTAHATAKKLRMATWNVFSSLVVTWGPDAPPPKCCDASMTRREGCHGTWFECDTCERKAREVSKCGGVGLGMRT